MSHQLSFEGSEKSLGSSDAQFERGETSEICEPDAIKKQKALPSIIEEVENAHSVQPGTSEARGIDTDQAIEIECRGPDHAQSLGLLLKQQIKIPNELAHECIDEAATPRFRKWASLDQNLWFKSEIRQRACSGIQHVPLERRKVKEQIIEMRIYELVVASSRIKKVASGISVVSVLFLDADFVEKEKWRYMALNQEN
ncbi:hypothetical protein ACLOJK_007940 [Asimina triloba]